jgi:hypothetical protein
VKEYFLILLFEISRFIRLVQRGSLLTAYGSARPWSVSPGTVMWRPMQSRGVCFSFSIFLWISFWEIQKLDGLESEKLRNS